MLKDISLQLFDGTPERDEFVTLARATHREFDDILDFVWKTPEFVEGQREVELDKLQSYPKGIKEIRWLFESRKLDHVFPTLMANGNLFAAVSRFETACLSLGKLLEIKSAADAINGSGISVLLSYFQRVGIEVTKCLFHEQVIIAIKIRNCLAHANGNLAWSRDEAALRTATAMRSYLHRDVRAIEVKNVWDPAVVILSDALGDRLQINNGYVFIMTSYLRDFFSEACLMASTSKSAPTETGAK